MIREPLAIVGGIRTPFVRAYGPMMKVQADRLGTIASTRLFEQLKLSPDTMNESVWGNVSGQPDAANLARVISLRAGVPASCIGHTVNRNCASGMEAIISSWQALQDRPQSKIILAGGTESMSNIPFMFNEDATHWFLQFERQKTMFARIAHMLKFRPSFMSPVVGIKLGLTDPVCKLNMGETAENLVSDFKITREEQDAFALNSHEKALAAHAAGFFDDEIVPVGSPWVEDKQITQDVGPRKGMTMESMAKLRPIFKHQGGSVTVGNSCPITDGAVALVVCLASEAERRGWKPLGYLKHYTIAGLDPSRMGLGPAFAIHQLCQQTGKTLENFSRFEINEAFASQVIACLKAMASPEFCQTHFQRAVPLGTIDPAQLNVNGGAIALGHPVGATGARLVLTLLRELRRTGLKNGLASLCVGGGQGVAMWLSTEQ
jgi:acetyl-CoA C-acetyltransferase/acetyl-CoA acyltransferase